MLGPFESFDCISAVILNVMDQRLYGLSMKGTSSCANHKNVNVIIFPLCVKFEWNYISDKELLDYVITLLNLLLKGARQDVIVFFIHDVKPQ